MLALANIVTNKLFSRKSVSHGFESQVVLVSLHCLVINAVLLLLFYFAERIDCITGHILVYIYVWMKGKWLGRFVASGRFRSTSPKRLRMFRSASVRAQLRMVGNLGDLRRTFRSGSADV